MRSIRDVQVVLVLSIAGPSETTVAELLDMNLTGIKEKFGDQFGVAASIGEHVTAGPSVRVTVTREEEG